MKAVLFAASLLAVVFTRGTLLSADPEVLRFGPYNAEAQAGFAAADEQAAANHQWKTELDGRIQLLVRPEFFTEEEVKTGVPVLLQAAHEIWKHSSEAAFSRETIEAEDEILMYTASINEGEEAQAVSREYRWVPGHRMVLMTELRGPEDAAEELAVRMKQIRGALSIEEDFEVSPCVKTYYMGQRFGRILKARENGLSEAREYAANLSAGLAEDAKEHAHHCWSHFYLLAYMESFNDEGEFLPEGHPREEAQKYLEHAASLRPDGQGGVLRLENLPELWAEGA